MTLNEIAYNIKSLVEGGYSTKDSNLSLRQIKAWINYHRLNILESYTSNGKNIPQSVTQNLGSFVAPEEGQFITLPQIATFGDTKAITSVTNIDNTIVFGRTSQDKIVYQEQSRFTSAMPKFYLEEGNKLYFHGSASGEEIKIIAVLEDPRTASTWTNDDNYYPLPSQLVNPLIKMVAEVELQLTMGFPGDIMNNELEADRETGQPF